jgi:hypothetical protein
VIEGLLQQSEGPCTVAAVQAVLREQYKRVQLTGSHRGIYLAKYCCRNLYAFTHGPHSSSDSRSRAFTGDSASVHTDDAILSKWRQALHDKAQQATVELQRVCYHYAYLDICILLKIQQYPQFLHLSLYQCSL